MSFVSNFIFYKGAVHKLCHHFDAMVSSPLVCKHLNQKQLFFDCVQPWKTDPYHEEEFADRRVIPEQVKIFIQNG